MKGKFPANLDTACFRPLSYKKFISPLECDESRVNILK